jgi:hypothetical protein
MYARVVRFTDVTPERIERLVGRIEESDGPPHGVNASGMQLLFDAEQSTAVAILMFDTAEDLRAADEAMNAMDPGDTPGTRASVDMTELKIERQA